MPLFLNDQPIEEFIFSGGECHVRISSEMMSIPPLITAYLTNSNDIMRLLMVVDALRRINPAAQIKLTIPYFPYARQDRVCNAGEALSIKVMADLINSLKCAEVIIYDPHSDVTPALLNNCTIVPQAKIVANSQLARDIITKNLVLISPDAGAEKKHVMLRKCFLHQLNL